MLNKSLFITTVSCWELHTLYLKTNHLIVVGRSNSMDRAVMLRTPFITTRRLISSSSTRSSLFSTSLPRRHAPSLASLSNRAPLHRNHNHNHLFRRTPPSSSPISPLHFIPPFVSGFSTHAIATQQSPTSSSGTVSILLDLFKFFLACCWNFFDCLICFVEAEGSLEEAAERYGFEKVSEEFISECKSKAVLFKHKKTGAEVMSVTNDDENKVFGVVFRTPP